MATQGIVSVRQGDAVLLKVIAGCDGYNAQQVADALQAEWPVDADRAYQIAREHKFGSLDNLVVMSAHGVVFKGDPPELHPRYRDTFQDPAFNPRWDRGIASHVIVVDAPAPGRSPNGRRDRLMPIRTALDARASLAELIAAQMEKGARWCMIPIEDAALLVDAVGVRTVDVPGCGCGSRTLDQLEAGDVCDACVDYFDLGPIAERTD